MKGAVWYWVFTASTALACSSASPEGPAPGAADSDAGSTRDDEDKPTAPTAPTDGKPSTPPAEGSSPGDDVPAPSELPPDDGVPPDPAPEPGPGAAPADNVLPRVTRAELNNVLRDALGDESAPASRFLAEDEFSPYDNDASRQTVSAALVDSLLVLAEDVAARLAHDPSLRAPLVPCEPTGPTDAACFEQTVLRLVPRLLRRPATPEDPERYAPLLAFAQESSDFFVALELLLTSLLQDPEFLYHIERGDGSGNLTAPELASRLSFLLWGSVPDEALQSEAALTGAVDAATARRWTESMLGDVRARRQLYRFHAMWLGYRAIPHSAELNAAFQLETEKLIERVVFEGQEPYSSLFTSSDTYLSSSLAEHYGLPLPESGEGWVTYPEDSGRAGILSHGSVLSGFSKFSDTSPTQRGILVRTRLLCQAVPPPPASVNVDEAPSTELGNCKADRYRAHREQSGCVECHDLFEPIGMGLENFDRAGVYREQETDNPDCSIEGRGTLPGVGEFSGPRELATLLVDGGTLDDCFVQQYLQFASSKGALDAEDLSYARELVTSLDSNSGRIRGWLLDLTSTERFMRLRREVSP